jgi:hypothetical protein
MTRRKRISWPVLSEALRYFFVGVITTIQPTDIIPEKMLKWVTLGLALAIMLLKSIDMAAGYQPKALKEKPSID